MNTTKQDEIIKEINETAIRINDDKEFFEIIDSLVDEVQDESNGGEKRNIAARPQDIQQ